MSSPEPLTAQELAAIRERARGPHRDPQWEFWALQDRIALLAHLDALTAAEEAVSDAVGNMALAVSKVPTHPQYLTDALDLLKQRDDAVLAILGEPHDA